ncbi:GNAT family N-acetyltransferase [Microlunatus soli]|uniref:Aminoglycoside 6'-N-acetyltransferase n=1 Tax=Microlunatus soli TaxID=630515 RepID=A0A1H1RIU0_9ACTN|nr:GNAT family N-acetyltransferase [Microlunatus soli]SDS35446.1 aminoglycoside 6'-N-acetyltransferase [Microlunatus soli]
MTTVTVRQQDGTRSTEPAGPADDCRPESWLAAARRLVAPGAGEPVAVDLSGAVKRFQVDDDLGVLLRPMTAGDLPDVLRWRRADHVRRWFPGPEPTKESIEQHYRPRIDDPDAVRMSVVEVNGRSIGLLQDYVIADQPGAITPAPDPSAVGGDYLIGEPSFLGRGLGTRMLWSWLQLLPATRPAARSVVVAPDHRNTGSLRTVAKVGFRQGIWFDERQPDGSVATLIACVLDLAEVIGD